MQPLTLGPLRRLVLIGAHADDIAIGAGATLLALAAANPGLTVRVLVCTGGGSPREDEERRALDALLPGADLDVTVLDLPDGRLPEHRGVVKSALQDLAGTAPDLVVAPQPADAHQDHRLLAEMAPTAFRDALILGYEIPKWEGDLGSPGLLHPVDDAVAVRKIEIILDCYPSQHVRDWFDAETFTALLRLRGVQCHRRYAEAFVAAKLVLDLAS